MKKYIFFILNLLFLGISLAQNEPTLAEKEKFLMKNFLHSAMNYHYKSVSISPEYSQKIFENYLEYLDAQKRYFLQSDINEFKTYEQQLADDLLATNTAFFNLTYSRLQKRLQQAESYYTKIMKKPFQFSKKEYVNLDFKNIPFEKTEKALEKRWVQVLKFSFLTNYTEKFAEEQKKKEKDASYQPKSHKTLQKEATEITKRTFDEWFASLKEMTREEWFSIFLNSYAEALDPHSNYFSPNLKEEFDANSSGKFVGIGAGIKKTPNGVEITDISAGGPIWKNKAIEVGDLILEVAQGEQKPVSVIGMRIQEVTKLLKGDKGTLVKLTIKHKDASIETISVVRDIVQMEETFAKTALIKHENKKFGLINLPRFYIDPYNYQERNAASDIALEIKNLNELNTDGLIIDLRNNAGGSLKTAIDIASYFIGASPVVQVRNANNSVQIFRPSEPSVRWEKPLVILVNEGSASASEILSGTLKDYKRAILIGSKQTYGKGTVQTLFNLNEFEPNAGFNLGATKLTIQKFYRVNGQSNQLTGIETDIVIPDEKMFLEVGERKAKNPLPNDAIKPANYTPFSTDFQKVISENQQRILNDSIFKNIETYAKWQKQKKDRKNILLTFESFKEHFLKDALESEKIKTLRNLSTGIQFSLMPQEQEAIKTNSDLKQRRTRWFETLEKDIYVKEAVKVLSDITN